MKTGDIVKIVNTSAVNFDTSKPMISLNQLAEVSNPREFSRLYSEMVKLCGSEEDVFEGFIAVKWLNPELTCRNGFYARSRFELATLDKWKA